MPSLTRAEAAVRAERLRVDAYIIDLDRRSASDSETFQSITTIRFACRRPGVETLAELTCERLTEVTLNGRRLDPDTLAGNRLRLSDLAADNELVVRADMRYSNTGEGLHRFVDPEDLIGRSLVASVPCDGRTS